MPRNRMRTVLAGAAALLVAAAPNAHGAILLSEDFESLGGSFTIYGSASRDCTQRNTLLCSLLVPASTGTSRSGADETTSRTMSGTTTLSFAFKPTCSTGNVDADVAVTFNTGSVRLHLTEGSGSPNDGVSLYSSTNDLNFTSWPAAGVWYTFTLTIDPAADTATATYAGSGSSGSVSIPSSATAITEIDLSAVNWGGSAGCDVHYDTVVLSS